MDYGIFRTSENPRLTPFFQAFNIIINSMHLYHFLIYKLLNGFNRRVLIIIMCVCVCVFVWIKKQTDRRRSAGTIYYLLYLRSL